MFSPSLTKPPIGMMSTSIKKKKWNLWIC